MDIPVSGMDIDLYWPKDSLEWLGHCPVCGDGRRAVEHERLLDNVFRCAPGKWTLFRCQGCRAGYLDPRPTPDSIGLAYRRYFTHAPENRASLEELNWMRRLRRALANGYRNHYYGTDERPASPLGTVLLKLLPSQRALIDAEARGLRKVLPGARLLDVGCGNGAFLDFARRAGWKVTGVDPDPLAVDAARKKGLDVQLGGVEVLVGFENTFVGITLGHVVEHLHDPLYTLQTCYRLLKPGGWL